MTAMEEGYGSGTSDEGSSGAQPPDEGSTGEQSPFVERLRPDPSQPPQGVSVLEGLLGGSDRPGFRRLYFTRSLTSYAEFRDEDVVHTEPIPPEQPPLRGLEAARVSIKRGAPIDYVRSTTAEAGDEFDLDVRLAAPRAGFAPMLPPVQAETWEAECPGPTWGGCETDFTCVCGDTVQITICRGHTCIDVCTDVTCRTDCDQATCATCRTQCNQATCHTCITRCAQWTCRTCPTACGTCQTCATHCNQATCHTCLTRCNQETCQPTCETRCGTCNPHVFTCGGRCVPP